MLLALRMRDIVFIMTLFKLVSAFLKLVCLFVLKAAVMSGLLTLNTFFLLVRFA